MIQYIYILVTCTEELHISEDNIHVSFNVGSNYEIAIHNTNPITFSHRFLDIYKKDFDKCFKIKYSKDIEQYNLLLNENNTFTIVEMLCVESFNYTEDDKFIQFSKDDVYPIIVCHTTPVKYNFRNILEFTPEYISSYFRPEDDKERKKFNNAVKDKSLEYFEFISSPTPFKKLVLESNISNLVKKEKFDSKNLAIEIKINNEPVSIKELDDILNKYYSSIKEELETKMEYHASKEGLEERARQLVENKIGNIVNTLEEVENNLWKLES